MEKNIAKKLVEDALQHSFEKERFTYLVRNLLNKIEETPETTYRGSYIRHAFQDHIKTLDRIGKYEDSDGKKIDILIVHLKKETSLERARSMQRNFVAWYLNGSRGGVLKDAALAAFISPDQEDWRFSFIKMEYKFVETPKGHKAQQQFTPARRYSFLVGENENSHTAQSCLVPILIRDEHNPTLEEIEDAFSIEKVTKEFFLKYRQLFIRAKVELDRVVKNDPKINADFQAKGVDTVNFAKKLLGQIIFLYFLQKKGWFGVGRDNDWGDGSKHFLRELFEKKHSDYNNFFNDILEPLFYEALRSGKDREHIDYYYSRFNCKIPFLNGGLFDPVGNYDWVHTDIIIPDSLFSNKVKTKEGDEGDGILDIFDRYNFTVKEDEPLEKEVAIDPELLGKAYEKFNAIRPDNFEEYKKALKSGKKGDESKFNKQFGVYYTPREIVHYMCQQSLNNYLHSELNKGPVAYEKVGDPQLNMLGNKGKKGQLDLTIEHKQSPVISKEDIETLIHIGEHVSENEETALIKEQNIKEGKQKTSDYKLKLPESVRKNAALIDHKLADITICDPAVGSGAFPVGMMSEIVRARNVLSTFVQGNCRTPYEFKRRCIEHSLYGVDIDAGAVEIAKLRLWLSLVVDEYDIKNIKPLPNLDYRIMQGNSLISEFMGINFDIDKDQSNENLMFKDEVDDLIEKFQHKKDEFMNESNVSRKSKLKEDVDDLLIEIFETELKTQKADYFNRLKAIENKYSILPNEKQSNEFIKQDKEKLYKESGFDLESAEKQLKEFTSGRKIKPFFLWNLYFSEVFHNKGGFDVVIANPPYVRQEKLKDQKKMIAQQYQTYTGIADLYVYFYEKGIKLLKSGGTIAYISSNKFFKAEYGKKLRKFLTEKVALISLIDFGDLPVFEATTYPCVLVAKRLSGESGNTMVRARTIASEDELRRFEDVFRSSAIEMPQSSLSTEGWRIEGKAVLALLEKIKKAGVPLGEYVKGQIYRGILTGFNKAFVIDEETKKRLIKKDKRSAEVIKPFLRGRDIKRYSIKEPGLYLIYVPCKWTNEHRGKAEPETFFKEELPSIHAYLKPFEKALKKRDDQGEYWWEMRPCKYLQEFEKPKIFLQGLMIEPSFALSLKGHYLNAPANFIGSDEPYLLGLLNSRLLWFFHKNLTISVQQGFLRIYVYNLEKLPIVRPTEAYSHSIVQCVKKILAAKKSDPKADTSLLSDEIDRLVYELYGLTKEEIAIVKAHSKSN